METEKNENGDETELDGEEESDERELTAEDEIDQLPLDAMPLNSNTLKKAKLIKNSKLQTVLELYNDANIGSLQLDPDALHEIFTTENEKLAEDQRLITRLSTLDSFDVFSLRGSLEEMGIEVENLDALELSEEMQSRLKKYAGEFTAPLLMNIFSMTKPQAREAGSIRQFLNNPDPKIVQKNLKKMSEQTGIPVAEIPEFIEEYSEVYMSVAYYRNNFESISGDMARFFEWVEVLKNHKDVAANPQTAISCTNVQRQLEYLYVSMQQRLELFQYNFEGFWKDINRENLQKLREEIAEVHRSMGVTLCGLVVKMRAWAREFPSNDVGGFQKRSKYVFSELEPGLDKLVSAEKNAREWLGLPQIRLQSETRI